MTSIDWNKARGESAELVWFDQEISPAMWETMVERLKGKTVEGEAMTRNAMFRLHDRKCTGRIRDYYKRRLVGGKPTMILYKTSCPACGRVWFAPEKNWSQYPEVELSGEVLK